MKRIFIFPTVEEATPFLMTHTREAVFVAGVGMAEIAAATVRAVKARKPQLAILCGIAGACDGTLQRGEVVEVVVERVGGLPERYDRDYEATGPETGLRPAAGVTVSRSGGSLCGGDGDNDGAAGQEYDGGEYLPEVENMEGAAFFAVCEALGVASCQIRAISNYVGEPFEEWAVDDALKNLTEQLTKICESHE